MGRRFLLFLICAFASCQLVYGQDEFPDCYWTNPIGCTDPWLNATETFDMIYSTSPMCVFQVTVYYKFRCSQYEVYEWSSQPTTAIPAGCASLADIYSFMTTPAFKNQLYSRVGAFAARTYAATWPGLIPNCPSTTLQITSKYASCMKPVVEYTFPGGSTSTLDYLSFNGWDYYLNYYSSTGGVISSIKLVRCVETSCCYQKSAICRLPDGSLSVTPGNWIEIGPCPPLSPSCTIKTCN